MKIKFGRPHSALFLCQALKTLRTTPMGLSRGRAKYWNYCKRETVTHLYSAHSSPLHAAVKTFRLLMSDSLMFQDPTLEIFAFWAPAAPWRCNDGQHVLFPLCLGCVLSTLHKPTHQSHRITLWGWPPYQLHVIDKGSGAQRGEATSSRPYSLWVARTLKVWDQCQFP